MALALLYVHIMGGLHHWSHGRDMWRHLLLEARQRGAAVVLISDDLDEVLALSDRILVMHDGQLTQAETRDRAAIGLLMAGTTT